MTESQSLRDRLIRTGVALLEEEGVAGLGLRAIARAAGVSHGAPRRHFPTHHALLAAIAAQGFAELTHRFTVVDTGGQPRERLRHRAFAYIDYATDHPEMFTLMFRHDLLEGSGENLRATTLPVYAAFVALLDPLFGPDTPDRALALWTNLHGVATLCANRSLRLVAPDADPHTVVDHILESHLP